MCNDDRKVWARHLENSRQEATLAQLITWMTTEMKSRMRATAPLRSVTQPPKLPVSHVGGAETNAPRVYRCWFCQNSNHWIDQCQKFTSLKPEDRIKAVKENHACFSCLKRAGRDHKSVNCSRRRQCPEKSNGIQCTFFHHPLLHGAMQPAVATASALTSSQRALLPIVQVDIVGTGRVTRKANALLDSGAQISLIKSSLAEDLKLRGKSVVVTITKVGGEEEELRTMMYRVQLRSIEDRSAHVIDAIGIPSISLFGVLLRFRENQVAFLGDISKMYHRIRIPEMDQQVHRFLWRNLETNREPDIYVKTVLTFGDKPAPAMAQTALRKTAKEAKETFPAAAKVIEDNTYMDDICDSVPTMNEANKLTTDLDSVLETGGFQVKGWVSNRIEKTENRQQEVSPKGITVEKVLGVVWISERDTLSFKVPADFPEGKEMVQLSKRKILSRVAQVYDPIGYATAFLIKAKIGLQTLWKRGISWDEDLPPDLLEKWKTLFEEMVQLNGVSFERCLTPPDAVGQPTLCVFSDASEEAFGACAYARWQLSSGEFGVRFIAAKSRVAPLKKLTIPRLELQGAVLASRLGKTILEECRFKFDKAVYFLDSRMVLSWICSEARRFKPFVSVRVGEIQDNSDPAEWRHIPGELNVADEVSRGISVKKLADRWQKGPNFLRLPESEWPQDATAADQREVEREQRAVHLVFEGNKGRLPLDCKKFSSWKRLVRVTAYTSRFVWNLRAHWRNRLANQACKLKDGPLSNEELQSAEKMWVKDLQTGLKNRLSKGEFKNLVNQRPIGRIPNDPDDGSYLCPNDILLGRASSQVPQGPFRQTQNPRHRFEFVQKIVDSFWTRWTRDVFPSLLPRKKWHSENRNVRVDDFVIMQSPNAVRGKWNVGRIINVYPRQDGRVRNVKIKTRDGEYQRPISKIAVIYHAEGYDDD